MGEEFSCSLVLDLFVAEQRPQLLENLLECIGVELNANLLFLVRRLFNFWLFRSYPFWQVVIVLFHLGLYFLVAHQATFQSFSASIW